MSRRRPLIEAGRELWIRVIVRRLRRMLPQGELTRGVLVLVLGTSIAQGVAILSAPLVTRFYTPSDLGALSVVTAILSVLLTVACLRYEAAIPLPEDHLEAANVLALSLIINLCLSIGTLVILLVAGSTILAALGASLVGPYAWLIAMDQLGGGAHVALTGWAIRMRMFPSLAATQVAQSGTLASAQIGFGIARLGAAGLILADTAARAVAALGLGRAAWRAHGPTLRGVTWRGVRSVATRYRRFAFVSTPSALVNTLGLQAPTILIVALYGTEVGGQLFLAQRIAALPITLMARSVGQVFFAEAARVARDEPTQLRSLFLRTTWSLARVGTGPTVLLAIASPVLFGPIFGEEWVQAGWFTAILAPMYLLTLVTSPTGAILDVLERQDLHFAREFLRLVLVAGAVIAASMLQLPPIGTVIALSVAGCATYCIYGLVSWLAIIWYRPASKPTAQP